MRIKLGIDPGPQWHSNLYEYKIILLWKSTMLKVQIQCIKLGWKPTWTVERGTHIFGIQINQTSPFPAMPTSKSGVPVMLAQPTPMIACGGHYYLSTHSLSISLWANLFVVAVLSSNQVRTTPVEHCYPEWLKPGGQMGTGYLPTWLLSLSPWAPSLLLALATHAQRHRAAPTI